jgi:hypothetical protein
VKLPVVFLELEDHRIEPPPSPEPGGAAPPPTEPFAALGEHPRDPLSVLPLSPSCLVHQSAMAAMLR